MTRGPVRRLLGEPLAQFFLLGAALFGLHTLIGARDEAASPRIEVTTGRIEHLATTFARTWQRPPTERELQGLIDEYVREEVYAREAAQLGLDRDDTVIRRRLRQKMEFLAEETAAPEPSDADLQRWLAQHAEQFRHEPRLAFRQVVVSRDRRGDAAEGDARALLERLTTAGPDGARDVAGDSTLLPRDVPLSSQSAIARQFGEGFAAALAESATGRWAGPIESAYGLHLVFVRQREDGWLPALDEVRDRVAGDWAAARRRETIEASYRKLRDRYTVVVERGGTTP